MFQILPVYFVEIIIISIQTVLFIQDCNYSPHHAAIVELVDTPVHNALDKVGAEEINFPLADSKADAGIQATEETEATGVIGHKDDRVNGLDLGAELIIIMQEGPVKHQVKMVKMMDTLSMGTCQLIMRSGGSKICSFSLNRNTI